MSAQVGLHGAGIGAPDAVASPATVWSDCVPSTPLISFPGGYTVSMCFEHEKDGETVQAEALDYGLGSDKSGLLWFFERDNAEILVKVLDGCAVNGHRWVFAAPVTTLAFNLRVDETATGRSWRHANPRGGRAASTASDLTAFPCAGAAVAGAPVADVPADGGDAAAAAPSSTTPTAWTPAGERLTDPLATASPIRAGEDASCAPGPVTTLAGGYTVRMCVEYERDGATVARNMQDYGLDSRQSALLYAFERDNAEVLIKVLDGCAVNGHRWVFVAPVTTLAFNLSIESPGGGEPWSYGNAFGRTAAARSDLSAFPCGGSPGADPDPGGGPGPGGPESFRGRITGYRGDPKDVDVLLMAEGVLRSARPDAMGWFEFRNLAAGKYAVKIHTEGHRTFPARLVKVPVSRTPEPFDLTPIPTDPFVYHWEEDQSTAGTEYAAAVNRPIEVEFEGLPTTVVDHTASNQLRHSYNMLLVDTDEASWTQEHAWRMLTTMRAIPQETRYLEGEQSLPSSRWLLTPEHLPNDIQVTRRGGETTVRVSAAAFVNAERRVAKVEGKRGVWFSKRLHHALVRYVTDDGRNESAYERIFQERFGVSTWVGDYVALTASTTGEDAGMFQKFHPREIIALLNAFEEFPSGMHKTQGLQYLVRRLDGLPHPLYPAAGAVAWTRSGYIEFMEKGLRGNIDSMQRLILHEKAHFLWEHVFDHVTKEHWIEIGGWHYDAGRDLWQTTKQTEFVSAYAHSLNPNEDMAETIAFFVFNPDKLRSRSVAKYEFVRDRIMQGALYVSRIREDLTFTVYNLFPDYVFPGKVRRVDIRIEGGPDEDKEIFFEIELHSLDGILEGASYAEARVFSDVGTFFDVLFDPVDAAGRRTDVGTVLRGEVHAGPVRQGGLLGAEADKDQGPGGQRAVHAGRRFRLEALHRERGRGLDFAGVRAGDRPPRPRQGRGRGPGRATAQGELGREGRPEDALPRSLPGAGERRTRKHLQPGTSRAICRRFGTMHGELRHARLHAVVQVLPESRRHEGRRAELGRRRVHQQPVERGAPECPAGHRQSGHEAAGTRPEPHRGRGGAHEPGGAERRDDRDGHVPDQGRHFRLLPTDHPLA